MRESQLRLSDDGPTLLEDAEVPINFWSLSVEEIPPLLFRAEDVARVLMVGRGMVFDLIRKKELRSIKVGGRRRVSAKALREYVDRLELQQSA